MLFLLRNWVSVDAGAAESAFFEGWNSCNCWRIMIPKDKLGLLCLYEIKTCDQKGNTASILKFVELRGSERSISASFKLCDLHEGGRVMIELMARLESLFQINIELLYSLWILFGVCGTMIIYWCVIKMCHLKGSICSEIAELRGSEPCVIFDFCIFKAVRVLRRSYYCDRITWE